ncbi:hypothetical protein BDE02_01G265000 [Populus trichocarpa]|nr:hypothetical protein BDE02_01G265000 [Populus trichocarpa]
MADNPLLNLFQTFQKVSNCIQAHLSNFTGQPQNPSPSTSKKPLLALTSPPPSSSKTYPANIDTPTVRPVDILNKLTPFTGKSAAAVTKEELGKTTWAFPHTLAAQYPEHPTGQQKKDVKELMILRKISFVFSCISGHEQPFWGKLIRKCSKSKSCTSWTHTEFSQWLCRLHNVVIRSPGKLVLPYERVDARWGKLECE